MLHGRGPPTGEGTQGNETHCCHPPRSPHKQARLPTIYLSAIQLSMLLTYLPVDLSIYLPIYI